MYLCVLCGSQNKQRLFPYTTLTDWLLDTIYTVTSHHTWTPHPSVCNVVPENKTSGGFTQNSTQAFFTKRFQGNMEGVKANSVDCHTKPAGVNELICVNSYVLTDFGETWYQWRILSLTKTGWVQFAFHFGAQIAVHRDFRHLLSGLI
jgi:hypothetical protein